jgi:hypothetical protein
VAAGFDGLAAEMLRAFRPLAREPDPLDVEVFMSGLLGAWWNRLPPGEDPDVVLGFGVVDYAERTGGRVALALLRALAVIGVAQELRDAASAAAANLAASGAGEPPWAGRLGRVEVGDCWRLGDLYGDQASLLVGFGYGRRRHGLVALVDFNHLGGWVKDLFVTAEPAAVLRDLRKAALSEPLATLDQMDPAEARRLLEGGLAATDQTWEPEVSEDFRQFRALALARCRVLPEPVGPTEPPPEIGDAERDAIVEEFLGSAHATGLANRDAARFCVRLLVDFGADYDGGKPLRVSPAKTEEFLHDWVPRKVVLDDADREALPAVVTAWVRWAGERSGLPRAAVDEVVEVATECGAHFGEAYEDADAAPTRLLLRGLTADSPEALQDALDRRLFAMPFFGTEIDGEDFPHLDPGDPDERGLLIQGEHPEYQRALADPFFEGEIDGANPRLHIALHEVVANQLWDDDPPAAWQAAKRLREAGMDRHDILHQLAEVAATHLHRTLADQQPVDPAAYDRALHALRPPSPARQARRARQGTGPRRSGPTDGAVYQVKISLRGASPPIWRRLRLPAAATLGQVHHVIQVAFGWDDSHLHDFEAGGQRYSRAEFGLESRQGRVHDEDKAILSAVAPGEGSRLRYTYDFGDSWEHELVVEKVLPPDGVPHAVCVAGRRAGPPEDCGGVWGYAELCDILADPDHPDRDERLDWLGDDYDPAAFDKHELNSELARFRLT